jgi:hypothetical protein
VIAVNVTEDGMPSVFSSREIFQAPSSTGFTPSMPWGMVIFTAVVGESSQPWLNENARRVVDPASDASGVTCT